LLADNKKIKAYPTSFVSGKITDSSAIISSLISSQKFFYEPNINFNPVCGSISRSNHYQAPSFAVNVLDIAKISQAKVIKGEIKVKKQKYTSRNLLVGNLKNPRNIIFSHYDSIGPGAIDNASGVAISLDLIINQPAVLKNNLFVIAGNEELSYDETVYWGHGYRVFEQKHIALLRKAKKILVVDCIGYDNPISHVDREVVKLGFPIKNQGRFSKKIIMISGSLAGLMPVYHSDLDLPGLIQNEFYKKTIRLIVRLLTRNL